MQSLNNNEPLVRDMFKEYWANYRIKPDAAEIDASVAWGMRLDKDALGYALNTDNHGELAQNRNPRLFDLKRLANGYRDARGDFFRAPLPDTRLPKEPECLYCAGVDVYDIVFEGQKWSIKKTGTCAVCSSGTARTNPIFIEIAELYNINVGQVMYHFTLSLLEYKFKLGLLTIPNNDAKNALETFTKCYAEKIAADQPRDRIAGAKPETGTQVPTQPGSTLDDDYELEDPTIPF